MKSHDKAHFKTFKFIVPSIIFSQNSVIGFEDIVFSQKKLLPDYRRQFTVKCTKSPAIIIYVNRIAIQDLVIGVNFNNERLKSLYQEKIIYESRVISQIRQDLIQPTVKGFEEKTEKQNRADEETAGDLGKLDRKVEDM